MPTVILTEAAAFEVKDMLKNNDMSDGYLKIKVNGGGCTGLTYGMSAVNALIVAYPMRIWRYYARLFFIRRKKAI